MPNHPVQSDSMLLYRIEKTLQMLWMTNISNQKTCKNIHAPYACMNVRVYIQLEGRIIYALYNVFKYNIRKSTSSVGQVAYVQSEVIVP